MSRVALEQIELAAEILRSVLVRTPLVGLRGAGEARETILLKPETLQPVGSFKLRGVYHAVAGMDPAVRACGLSTVSAGNTAQALAWCGRHFGVPARSVMPETAPRAKIEAVLRLGGEPVLVPVDDVFRFLSERAWERESFAFVHPWTDRAVMTGHGTLGLEIVADAPDVESVWVPVGGGGLIGGVACALKALNPRIRVIAVEPEGCPALHASLAQGRPVRVACDTFCDGVAVPYITDEMFPLLRDVVDEVVLVTEEAVRAAIRELAFGNGLVVEGSAALPVAAALSTPARHRGKTVCLLTGCSVDRATLLEILASGGAGTA